MYNKIYNQEEHSQQKMKEHLRKLCLVAKDVLASLGLEVFGLHYVFMSDTRTPGKCIGICFDAYTHNQDFFGKEAYQNYQRQQLLAFLYEKLFDAAMSAVPRHRILLDVYVRLEPPRHESSLPFHQPTLEYGFVDVTKNSDVRLVSIDEALKNKEITPGSMLERYCRRYGLPYLLRHGRHFISPDVASVETFEAIARTIELNSVLEIGAGVGTCGAAAQMMGIKDFTFVDISPLVCNYLREHFSFPVIEKNAFDFTFNRHWDLVLMGLPYELNPWFVAKKGEELFAHSDIAVFQSGCLAFFQFEHDWIFGRRNIMQWPWWKSEQTLPFYFPVVFEADFDYQTCIIAMSGPKLFAIADRMKQRGFAPIRYETILLS